MAKNRPSQMSIGLVLSFKCTLIRWPCSLFLSSLGRAALQVLHLVSLTKSLLDSDCLARQGLDHPERCPLCDQEEENIQHLLTSCVFTRSVWFSVLSLVRLQHLSAGTTKECTLMDWWRLALQHVRKHHHKGFNSLVVLVAWWIWKHRNGCIF